MKDSPASRSGDHAAVSGASLAEQDGRMPGAAELDAVGRRAADVGRAVEGGDGRRFLGDQLATVAVARGKLPSGQAGIFEEVAPRQTHAAGLDEDGLAADPRGDAVRQVDVAPVDLGDAVFTDEGLGRGDRLAWREPGIWPAPAKRKGSPDGLPYGPGVAKSGQGVLGEIR